MTYTIKRMTGAAENASPPVREIPGRLDASAIRRTLAGLGVTLPDNWQSITAAGQFLDRATVQKLDTALSASGISISERMRFKYKLTEHGLLPRGRALNFNTVTPDVLDPWRARFKQ
jgi:hypothetical protein